MRGENRPPLVVHVTTVPMTLRFLVGHIAHLKARDFDVHAISSPGPGLFEFEARQDVPVHGVSMQRGISPLRDLLSLFKLWWVLRKLRPMIVHAHTPKAGFLGMIAAWLARVPVRIYHLHGLRLSTIRGWKRTFLGLTEQLACRLAHRVLCVSRSVRDEAVSAGLCPDSKIYVPANGSICGVDALGGFNPEHVAVPRRKVRCELGLPPEARVIGFVGRIVRDKGVPELVAAWDVLRQEFQDAHLLIVGPFEDHDPLPPEILGQIHSDPRVHLTGWVDDLAAVYSALDILVLPSLREGFGQVAVEAAAMQLPVVATRIPGIVDAVEDGATGSLVPAGDSAALADAIRTYLEDEALRLQHGRAGRERVLARFRPEDIFEAIYKEYLRMMRERNLPPPCGTSGAQEVERCSR